MTIMSRMSPLEAVFPFPFPTAPGASYARIPLSLPSRDVTLLDFEHNNVVKLMNLPVVTN